MRTIKKLLFTILIFLFGTTCLYSQESIVTSGGDISSTTGSVSYTIGQVFYETNSNSNNYLVEGVQQPFEIMISSLNPNQDISFNATVFPNPATNSIIIEVSGTEYQKLNFQLYDMLGKCIYEGILTNIQTEINIANLAQATYYLKIILNDKTATTFKIIKTANY